jgi:N-methylhydantoinase A
MDSAAIVDQIEKRFHRRHEDLYTYSSPDQEVVFVNARVCRGRSEAKRT